MTDAQRGSGPDEPVPLEVPDVGDPVCWLDRVCPECGAFNERPAVACRRCGALADDEEKTL